MSQGGWLAKKQIDMGRTAVWGTRPVCCISQHTFLLRSHGSQAHGTCPLGLLQVDSRWAFRILRGKPAPTYGFLAQKSGDLLQMPLATISESRNGLHQCIASVFSTANLHCCAEPFANSCPGSAWLVRLQAPSNKPPCQGATQDQLLRKQQMIAACLYVDSSISKAALEFFLSDFRCKRSEPAPLASLLHRRGTVPKTPRASNCGLCLRRGNLLI